MNPCFVTDTLLLSLKLKFSNITYMLNDISCSQFS